MSLVGVVVAALAGFRLARAVALDTISRTPREWIWRRAFLVTGWAGPDEAAWTPTVLSRPWAWVYGLVSCPFCVGFWLTLGLYGLWTEASWARWPLLALAATGVQAALTSWTLEP